MALFGTDGVRGVANVDLTAELAVDLAIAAAHVLGEIGAFAGHRPKAIVAQEKFEPSVQNRSIYRSKASWRYR